MAAIATTDPTEQYGDMAAIDEHDCTGKESELFDSRIFVTVGAR